VNKDLLLHRQTVMKFSKFTFNLLYRSLNQFYPFFCIDLAWSPSDVVFDKDDAVVVLLQDCLATSKNLERQRDFWENVLETELDQIPAGSIETVVKFIDHTKMLQEVKCKMYFELIDQYDKDTSEDRVFFTDLVSFRKLFQKQVNKCFRFLIHFNNIRIYNENLIFCAVG